jgi:hypothetical protein
MPLLPAFRRTSVPRQRITAWGCGAFTLRHQFYAYLSTAAPGGSDSPSIACDTLQAKV